MTQNATWCQNRGCICISSVRRTYGRIHMLPAYIQSSSKYNNSVNRIISKEEREDPRRDSSIYLRVQITVVFPHSYKNYKILFEYSVFYKNYSVSHAIQQLQVILHTELILLQEFSKKYYNYKAHPVQINTRHLPVTVFRVSKHSTWQNPAIRPLQHKQASSNSTR